MPDIRLPWEVFCGFRGFCLALVQSFNQLTPGYVPIHAPATSSQGGMIAALKYSSTREAKTIRNVVLHRRDFGYNAEKSGKEHCEFFRTADVVRRANRGALPAKA